LDDVGFVQKMKLLDIDLEDLPDIFEILDDGDGQVDQNEFCYGLMSMQGPAMSCEMMRATCAARQQNIHFQFLDHSFGTLSKETFDQVGLHVDELHENMHDLMYLAAEVMTVINNVGLREVVRGTVKMLPTLLDPDMDSLITMEKERRRQEEMKEQEKARRYEKSLEPLEPPANILKSAANREPVDEHWLHPGSFVDSVVPPTWIVRNERTPLMQNPGKLKLLQHPELEEKILMSKPKSKAKKVVLGTRREFGKFWQDLNLPLTEVGTLRGPEMDDDPLCEPQPSCVSNLPVGCIAGQRPAASTKSDPLAALGLPIAQKASTNISTVAGGQPQGREEHNKSSKKKGVTAAVVGPSLPGEVLDK
jgi:hypothetical protein